MKVTPPTPVNSPISNKSILDSINTGLTESISSAIATPDFDSSTPREDITVFKLDSTISGDSIQLDSILETMRVILF